MTVRKMFESAAVNAFLGLELLEASPDGAAIRMPVRDEHIQETGVVQGGILAAVADTTAVYALAHGFPEGHTIAGVEFKLNFLRPARPDRGDLHARATIVRKGRTLGICRVDVTQAEVAVATGLFTYLFSPR